MRQYQVTSFLLCVRHYNMYRELCVLPAVILSGRCWYLNYFLDGEMEMRIGSRDNGKSIIASGQLDSRVTTTGSQELRSSSHKCGNHVTEFSPKHHFPLIYFVLSLTTLPTEPELHFSYFQNLTKEIGPKGKCRRL